MLYLFQALIDGTVTLIFSPGRTRIPQQSFCRIAL